MKWYYRILRDLTAMKILASLVASPERYSYISREIESGHLTNKSATEKNINKSLKMADQFIERLRNM